MRRPDPADLSPGSWPEPAIAGRHRPSSSGGGGFYPAREALSRTGCSRGTRPPDQRSLPEPETPVTKPASAAAAARRPLPVIVLRFRQPRPGAGGSLSHRPQRDRTPRRSPDAGGSADPVDAGREPGEMAPRPYHLVLRAIPARRTLRGLQAVSSGLRLSVQFLLCQRRTAARPSPARPSDPPRRRGSHRLPPACRCRRGEIPPDRRRGRARRAGAAGRSRPQSRAAASGIDADRHPACVRAKPDSAGLRSGMAIPRFGALRRRMDHPQRGHSHRRARRRQLSFRQ